MADTANNTREITSKDTLLLLLIVLTGGLLRFYKLDFQSYWLDELWSIHTSRPDAHFWQMIRTTVSDVHPPLYQILLWFWLKIFGFTEFSGRALSALLGTLVIPAIFLLGKKLFDKQTAFFASAIVALNIFFITYAQEARSYALLALLTVGCFHAFLLFLEKQTWKSTLWYGLLMALLINTHYYGLLVVFIQAMIVLHQMLIQRRPFRTGLIITLMAIFCLSLCPFLSKLLQNAALGHKYWMEPPGFALLLFCILTFYMNQVLVVLGGLLACLAVWHGVRKSADHHDRQNVLMLVFWFCTGLAIPVVSSYLLTPNLTARNLTIIQPAFCLLAAYGMRQVPGRILRAGVVLIYVGLSFLPLFVTYDYYNNHAKMQYRQIVKSVIANDKGEDIYVLGDETLVFNVYFKYFTNKSPAKSQQELLQDIENHHFKPNQYFFIIDSLNYMQQFKDLDKLLIIKKYDAFGGMVYYKAALKQASF